MMIKFKTNYKNLGMQLEKDIDITNKYYINKNYAFVYKKPTPIKIVEVNFDKQNNATIKKAFFKEKSTTDYNGISNGYYIDFDAKETESKTSFPFSNIRPHQINHLKNIYNSNGISFLIINFKSLNKYYIMPYKILIDFLKFKKSISISDFNKFNLEIKINFHPLKPRLDYLNFIFNNLKLFLKEKSEDQ